MTTIRISATKARNNFFDLLNQVALGTQVIIERDKKEVAIISPKPKTDWAGLIKASKAAHGILKGLSVEEIAPLRKKGAWGNFGNWDKDLKLDTKK